MIQITKTLLTIEQNARKFFERIPFTQAFIAGAGAIIFWRGIWELLDRAQVSPGISIVLGALLLGSVGVFIQTFIGNTIIIRSVKEEEKMEQKALRKMQGEVSTGEVTLKILSDKIDALTKRLENRQDSSSSGDAK